MSNSPEYERTYGRQEQRRDAGLEPPPGIGRGGGGSGNNSGCMILVLAVLTPLVALAAYSVA